MISPRRARGQPPIDGLVPTEETVILSASSDHLVVESMRGRLKVGDEVTFQLDYSAMVRAMT